jgi:hypothetical protein
MPLEFILDLHETLFDQFVRFLDVSLDAMNLFVDSLAFVDRHLTHLRRQQGIDFVRVDGYRMLWCLCNHHDVWDDQNKLIVLGDESSV